MTDNESNSDTHQVLNIKISRRQNIFIALTTSRSAQGAQRTVVIRQTHENSSFTSKFCDKTIVITTKTNSTNRRN